MWPFGHRPARSDDWADRAAAVPGWSALDDGQRTRLVDLADQLLREKRWEPARDFELTDGMCTTIALVAALAILELGVDAYDDVGTVIVHPTTHRSRHLAAGPTPGTLEDVDVDVLGLASYGGPVTISWAAVDHDLAHPGNGHNVILHEFAHKLDMADQVQDGTPLLADDAERRRWYEVCTAAYERLVRGEAGPVLSDYGATNVAEFFAVATEAFFDRPGDLRDQEPALYVVLADYYRQDPAGRLRT